jgi:hypothetical protein
MTKYVFARNEAISRATSTKVYIGVYIELA